MKKNEMTEGTRIPERVDNIQVNFCKNPVCKNFGIPASTEKQPRGPGAKARGRDLYSVNSRENEKGHPVPCLECELCGEKPPIKSNLAVSEEMHRMMEYINERPIGCPDPKCPNHLIDRRAGKVYFSSFGKTKSGSQRYRCKLCSSTFAVGSPTKQQREPHKNIQVFRLLVNKMPLKRIAKTADISMPTLYDKIDFIHRQCTAFSASREKNLLDGLALKRLYIAVDRQDYMVNWTQSRDKRNVVLSAVGSADNTTGYVFGMHLNFDPAMDPVETASDATAAGDSQKRSPYRKYARLWLPMDYQEALAQPIHYHSYPGKSLGVNIASTYTEATGRDDVEVAEVLNDTIKLPQRGMQVHSEYTLYGHFFYLRKLLPGVEKIRFFMDQESGIRAACVGAFADDIKQGRCDAFYVRINKDLTVDERKKALGDSRKKWNKLKRSHPELTDSALKLHILKERIKKVRTFGKWNDRWVLHPFPDMSEPEKAACYLTDTGQYDEDHVAWLYNKASLHAIDRFFMQARRRISLLERPIATPSAMGRKWYGYSPYNPSMVVKVLGIFRVFYNYVEPGKDKQSPAMRLGLAKGNVGMEDIIYFAP